MAQRACMDYPRDCYRALDRAHFLLTGHRSGYRQAGFFQFRGGPDVAAWRDDDALHLTKLPAEIVAFRWRERLAIVIEPHNRSATIGCCPDVVIGFDSHAEADALDAAPGIPRGHRRQGPTIGRELGEVAGPRRQPTVFGGFE